jgi:hypothetical protein
MIIGGFAARVRILLEKDRQDTIFRKIRKIPEKYQKIIFYQRTPEARRRSREEPEGSLTHRVIYYYFTSDHDPYDVL